MTQFAFIFPGQGSQSIGMLSNIATQYPIIEQTFNEASGVLGYDLWALVQKGSYRELGKTWRTQPAVLTASVALWRIWEQNSKKHPVLMAGHSLGEYSALVCAGVINFTDAVRLVEMRGRFMQEAVPENVGAMASIIGLDSRLVEKACKESAKNQIVSLANFNSLHQVVIAGHKEAVERAEKACRIAGAKRTLPLSISVPSHCVLMQPAAEKLAVELRKIKFNTPLIPVINNVDVKCETTPEAICNALIRQLYSPVQWTKTIEFISTQNIELIYEVGPGKILAGLTKHIINTLTVLALNKLDVLSVAFSK